MSSVSKPVSRSVFSSVHRLTNVPAALLGSSGPAPNSAEAQQFYDRLFTPPDSTWEARYGAFIDALVAGGVWAKLDFLYLPACRYESDAFVNLISSSYLSYRDESSGQVTWTQYGGFSTGGSARNINTRFNPTTAVSPKYTRNDAMVGMWCSDNAVASTNQPAIVDGVAGAPVSALYNLWLTPSYNAGTARSEVNSLADTAYNNSGATGGLWCAQRTSSTNQEVWLNGQLKASSSVASQALANSTIINWSAFPNRIMFGGSSLTSGQHVTLYNACAAFVLAVTGGAL